MASKPNLKTAAQRAVQSRIGLDKAKSQTKVKAQAKVKAAAKKAVKFPAKKAPAKKGTDWRTKAKVDVAAKAAAKVKAKAASTATPAPPADPMNVATDTTSSPDGTLNLQSNYELDSAETAAIEEKDAAIREANAQEEQAKIANTIKRNAFEEQKKQQLARNNAMLAARGFSGGAGFTKDADLASKLNEEDTNIGSELTQAVTAANTARTTAETTLGNKQKDITLGRRAYTEERSKTAPTAGSSSVDAGVKATTPAPNAPVAAKAPKAPKAPTAKTYKGKYKGPDRFKGDAKKLAAYRAAKRKAGKK